MIRLNVKLACQMLVMFHEALDDEVGQAFCQYLQTPNTASYIELARALWRRQTSLQDYLIDQVLHADNAFTRAAEAGKMTSELLGVGRSDLHHLGTMFGVLPEPPAGVPELPAFTPAAGGIRAKFAATSDWGELAEDLVDHIRRHGAGDDGRYHAFRWEEGCLQGISKPDPIRLEDLVGNQDAKGTIIRNTEQFLQGYPANNLLLYGDRGTGKSSTVKALVHQYGPQGLRLVEVSRSDLSDLGAVMRILGQKSMRYVVFIDDLSFEDFEVSFKTFKAMLEGSLEQRPTNVLVYATTNRRRLVRERWQDRGQADDEVRPGDTLQEINSLADRFGMTVMFATPDQQQYLAIVDALAQRENIHLPPEDLHRKALQWALWHNGWSGRTARQFVDDLMGKMGIRQG